jgi:hypothetical protein
MFGMKGVGGNNNGDCPEELLMVFGLFLCGELLFEWNVMIHYLRNLTAAIHFLKLSNFAAICAIYVKGEI